MEFCYTLDGHEPVPCDLLTWAEMMETADRHVGLTIQDDVHISTVFLGIDHSFRRGGPPLLFETMMFAGDHGDNMERYATWDEAEAGHARWVAKIFKPTPILALPK